MITVAHVGVWAAADPSRHGIGGGPSGSDWIRADLAACQAMVYTGGQLVAQLRQFYAYTLLPAEVGDWSPPGEEGKQWVDGSPLHLPCHPPVLLSHGAGEQPSLTRASWTTTCGSPTGTTMTGLQVPVQAHRGLVRLLAQRLQAAGLPSAAGASQDPSLWP